MIEYRKEGKYQSKRKEKILNWGTLIRRWRLKTNVIETVSSSYWRVGELIRSPDKGISVINLNYRELLSRGR